MSYHGQLVANYAAVRARLHGTEATAVRVANEIRDRVDAKLRAERAAQEARDNHRKMRQRHWRKLKILHGRRDELLATGQHLIRWRDNNRALTLSMEIAASYQEPRLHDLLKHVAWETGFSVADLKSHRRHADVCQARQWFYWLARTMTSRSLPEIGNAIGGRDHTTVFHGIAAHCKRHGVRHPNERKQWRQTLTASEHSLPTSQETATPTSTSA